MKFFMRTAITLIGLGFAPWTSAATPPLKHSATISYYQNSTEFSTDAGTIIANLDNLMLRYGYDLFPSIGIEGTYGFSALKSDEDGNSSVENRYLAGAYARGVLDLKTINMKMVGRVGMTRAKNEYIVRSTVAGSPVSTNYITFTNGLSYGLGAEFYGSATTALHIEWMRFLNTDDAKSSGWMFGLTHHFDMPKLW